MFSKLVIAAILTISSGLCMAETLELYCAGNFTTRGQELGETEMLITLDFDRNFYEVSWGGDEPFLSGKFTKNKLSYIELVTGEDNEVYKSFSLGRISLEFGIIYAVEGGGHNSAKGKCEKYQPVI